MARTTDRDAKSAAELKQELAWAASVLLGADASKRIEFHEPMAAADDAGQFCNWDVTVSCGPEDDEIVQAAIRHVAERWNLA
jgi:hypothetical protein